MCIDIILNFVYVCLCLCFRVCKVLFPPIPRPPSKYKYFLEKNYTFNVSMSPYCTHTACSHPTPLIQPHLEYLETKPKHYFLCSVSRFLCHQLSLRKRSQKCRMQSKTPERHFKSNTGRTHLKFKNAYQGNI